MCEWLYTIRERFTPESHERWRSYLSFSGFAHIAELVTLDSMMCPDLVTELRDDDWKFNVQEDFRTELFRDPDYLMARQRLDQSLHKLLAIVVIECDLGDGSATVAPFYDSRLIEKPR